MAKKGQKFNKYTPEQRNEVLDKYFAGKESSRWWLCAVDIIEALSLSNSPRIYWATIKRRNPELIAICKQLKLTAKDGKKYLTDVMFDGHIRYTIEIVYNFVEAIELSDFDSRDKFDY